jgi:hypothetical protein
LNRLFGRKMMTPEEIAKAIAEAVEGVPHKDLDDVWVWPALDGVRYHVSVAGPVMVLIEMGTPRGEGEVHVIEIHTVRKGPD